MYAALRLDLPAAPGPDQRDRNDLLIVLDMFQVLERRVELGHIAFGVIADVAKPVVPFLPRLEDEVVYIALAEQTVGGRMLLRSIYGALDQNSHLKLFQLVSRRGFGLAGNLDDIVGCALIVCPLCCAVVFLQIQLDPDRFSRGMRISAVRVKLGNILRRLDLDRAELQRTPILHRADHFEGARLKGHRPFAVRSIVRNALHDEIQIRVGKGRLIRSGHRRALDIDDCADASTGLTSGRDELPTRAVVLPRDVGLLPGVRVGVRGDKGKIVIGFDKLISLELELIRPLAVGFIFPDVRAFLLDFLVSVGVAAQREIFLCRILPAVGVRTSLYTLNENRTALIQRGLAGLGGGVALDLDDRGNVTDQLPLAVLPLPFELDALVWLRIGVGFVAILTELLNVFRSVQCDGIVVCSIHLKQAVYVCAGQDAIVLRLMRGRILDALHTDLDLRVCNVRLRAAGIVRHGRVVLLPDRVEFGDRGGCCNRIARLDGRLRCVRIPSPAEEVVAFSGRLRGGNVERHRAGAGRFSLRVGYRHIGDCVCRVFVVVQGVGLGTAVVLLGVIPHIEHDPAFTTTP